MSFNLKKTYIHIAYFIHMSHNFNAHVHVMYYKQPCRLQPTTSYHTVLGLPILTRVTAHNFSNGACVHPHARVCGRECIHMRRRAYVRVHAYARAPVYTYMRTRMYAHACTHVCADGGSWWWRLGVSGGVLGARTHLCACACMCTRMCMGAYVHGLQ